MEPILSLGCHVSFTKQSQLLGSLTEALSYGANTFMFYTGAPQNTIRYPIDDALTIAALEKMRESDIDYQKVVVHAPYLINLANSLEKEKYQFSIRFLQEEVDRCEQLGITYLILHPGSHVGCGVEQGIRSIAYALNQVLVDTNVMILLETMAGKGTEIGSRFEELKAIIDQVEYPERVGICLDTCHLHDAGYDTSQFDLLLEEFDRVIGLSKVKCIHINDSKNLPGTHKDRHENFGFGDLGFSSLLKIVYHDKLKEIPKILETPYVEEHPPYKEEIAMIRFQVFDEQLKEKIKTN